MKDSSSMHKHVQEMCDCFATKDPLKEMSALSSESDPKAATIKWVALAVLHGMNNNAEKITLSRGNDGKVSIVAEYRPTELPAPGDAVGQKIVDAFREMTHIDTDKGKTALALGIRDSSIDLRIKIKNKHGGEKITLGFPGA